MHSGLHWARGKASEHECACGKLAKNWAYLYTSKNELVAEDGSQYSENFDDYAPMCWSCHRKYDTLHSPQVKDAVKAWQSKGDGWRDLEARRRVDPELRERLGAIRRENGRATGLATNAIRRTCGECELTSNPPGIGRHQKYSGHNGYRDAT
jgi:hypothetical protein